MLLRVVLRRCVGEEKKKNAIESIDHTSGVYAIAETKATA